MLKDLQIETATSKDIDEIAKLVKLLSKQLLEQGHPNWDLYYDRDVVKQKLENNEVWLLKEKNKIIGTVSLSTSAVEYYPKSAFEFFEDPSADAMYITMLGVHPEDQGKGYASYLLTECEKYSKKKDLQYVRFDARAFIEPLVRFYMRRDYKIVGVIMDHDEEETPYFLFEKTLI